MASSRPQGEMSNVLASPILTASLCREARTLLDLEPGELAFAARVPITAVLDFEQGTTQPHPNIVLALRTALERAGAEFTPGQGRRGVRLRKNAA